MHSGSATKTEPARTQREPLWPWAIAPWILAALWGGLTLLRSQHIGIEIRDPGGIWFVNRLRLSLAVAAGLLLLDALVRVWAAQRRPPTARQLGTFLRTKWTPWRIALSGAGLGVYYLVYLCYHNLKSWDVFNEPRDQLLLEFDRWLFLGHSPHELLHSLFGTGAAMYVIAVVYETFGTLVVVGVVAVLVVPTRIRDGFAAINSALWVWIFGVAAYYAIPSLGPFWSAPEEFADLPRFMIQDTQDRYLAQRDYLLAHPHASDAYAQVSAFASLHVGVTTVILLMCRWYGLRWATRLMTLFLAGTVVATVYLGWHFVADDIVGFAMGWLAVALGTRMTYPRGRRPGPG